MFLRRLLAASLAATAVLTLAPSSGASSFGSFRPAVDLSPQAPDTTPDAPPATDPRPGTDPRPAGPVVNQGDLMISAVSQSPEGITINSRCTIGYIDHAHHRAWTASHCGSDGTTVTNAQGEKIGTLQWANGNRYAPGDNLERSSRDIAYINFDSHVVAGTNSFSGDTIIDRPAYVETGAQACAYGQTTRHETCGTTRMYPAPAIAQTNVARVDNLAVQRGDSGGPVWVPGRGFLGVIASAHGSDQAAPYVLVTQPPR